MNIWKHKSTWILLFVLLVSTACSPRNQTSVAPTDVPPPVETEQHPTESPVEVSTAQQPSATDEPVVAERGSLTFAWPMGVPNLDPMKAVAPPGTLLYPAIFDALTLIEGGEVLPALATDWELADDNLSWSVKLREGVTFSNGEPFNAEAVRFTYERALNPDLGLSITARVATIAAVDVVDDYTVRFVTKSPDPIFPRRMAAVYMLPPQTFQSMGEEAYVNAPIGTGPFRVAGYVPLTRITLEAWDESWRGAPSLKELVVLVLPEANARSSALRAGDVDFTMDLAPDDAKVLLDEGYNVIPNLKGQVIQVSLDVFCGQGYTTESLDCPLADRRVRQAMNYAVDKEAIAESILGGFVQVMQGQHAMPGTFGFNPDLTAYPYDPDKARELLAEAGYPDGFSAAMEVTATNPDELIVSEAVVSYLADVGVQVDLQPLERPIWLEHFHKGRSPFFTAAWGWLPALDSDFVLVWFSSLTNDPRRRSADPTFEAAYMAATREMDPAVREELLQEANAALREDAPDLFLVSKSDIWAANGRVQGLEPQPTGLINFDILALSPGN
ncbi:MAG: ABC transporter substrate-binding protein [Verrucomicrobia bacterium]|nr:ABC transporter substrate-binding protein [Verrucomicrobiota bacterium]